MPACPSLRRTRVPLCESTLVRGLDPEIDQWSVSPFRGKMRFGDRMLMMQVCVESEASYEYDCKGTSRRQEMLTDSFRQECHDRGSRMQPVRTGRLAE